MAYAQMQSVRGRRRAPAYARALGEVQLAETLVTPGDVVGAMDTINRAVLSLAHDVNSHQAQVQGSVAGRQFFVDWMRYLAEWQTYYAANHTGYSLSTQAAYAGGVLVAQIREKASAYNALERRFSSVTGAEPTMAAHDYVSWGEQLSRLGQTGMMWAGLGIVGVIALGYLVSNVAKFRGAARLVMNRRRRRRR